MSKLQQLANEKCAIKNDGTVEDLNRVIKASGKGICDNYCGAKKFYLLNTRGFIDGSNSTDLPAYSVKEFIAEIDGVQMDTDNFMLPEKWCIRQDTSKEVCKWFIDNASYNTKPYTEGYFKYLCYPEHSGFHKIYSDEILDGYTEITFDQFKKYVLKEDATISKTETVEKFAVMLIDSTEPTELHDSYESAEKECLRLVRTTKRNGYVLKVVSKISNQIKIEKV